MQQRKHIRKTLDVSVKANKVNQPHFRLQVQNAG